MLWCAIMISSKGTKGERDNMNPKYRKTLDEIYEALKEFNDESIKEIFSLLNMYANEKEKELARRIKELRDIENEEMSQRQS